jgi:hypothetical protein
MNATTTVEPLENGIGIEGLMLVICMGSILVCAIIVCCCMCYKNNKDDKEYIAWVKAKKRGDPFV